MGAPYKIVSDRPSKRWKVTDILFVGRYFPILTVV